MGRVIMQNTYRDERRDRKRRELQRKRMKQRLLIIAAIGLVIGLAGGIFVGSLGKKALKEDLKAMKEKYETQSKEDNETVEDTEGQAASASESDAEAAVSELPWNLTFVNPWNEMEEGYKPELTEVEPGMLVDSRIATDLKNMLDAAKAEGLSPFICSAYRSIDRQEELFNNKVDNVRNTGLGYYDAYVEAAKVVAVPGTSEHALGLAVDIVSAGYTNLDEGQEDTAEFKWFKENCYKYGFILRYPNGTTDITGIIYEPWHYRYVGVDVATEITNLGVTFEEYMTNHYNK